MSSIGDGREGGGVGGVSTFWDPPSRIYWGIFSKLQLYIWSPQLKPSRLAPFLSKLVKGGICAHFQKSQAHALGAGRRVSQADEATINPKLTGLCQHEIVSGILKK